MFEMAAWREYRADYDSSTFQVLGLIVLLTFAVVYLYRRLFLIRYPADAPRVRDVGKSRFSLRTRWAYYTDCANLLHEAYERVSS